MTDSLFWTKMAPRYAKRAISDTDSYDRTLNAVRAHLKPEDRMLEIGCGTGSTAIMLGDAVGSLLATDYAAGMIDIAQAKDAPESVRFRVATLDDLAHDPPFDVVAGFNLLHLMPELETDLRKINGLLRTGGLFISKSTCISGWSLWMVPMIAAMRAVGKAPFIKTFSHGGLEAMIKAAGFDIVQSEAIPAGSRNRFIVARKR